MNHNSQYQHAAVLGYWLLFCAVVVYIMVVVGGITRLTESGLSMVDWKPIMGIIPPIGEQAWMAEFNQYRTSPEYLLVNKGMSLDEFKNIFYWEYGHRVLGRVIGMIYLIPLVIFLIRGMVPKAWYARLFGLLVLGGLQGLMGWYMVKSGLVDVAMLWFALDFLRGDVVSQKASAGYLTSTSLVVVVVFVMMLSGGFVAGTKAGYIINTFPTMNGEWLPSGWLSIEPAWKNLFENPVMIQFIHRSIAVLVVIAVLSSFMLALKQRFATLNVLVVSVMVIQVCLGISALVLKVPLVLGAAHQAGAVALLATALLAAHIARKDRT